MAAPRTSRLDVVQAWQMSRLKHMTCLITGVFQGQQVLMLITLICFLAELDETTLLSAW